jgi:hypothetical protein
MKILIAIVLILFMMACLPMGGCVVSCAGAQMWGAPNGAALLIGIAVFLIIISRQ